MWKWSKEGFQDADFEVWKDVAVRKGVLAELEAERGKEQILP